MKIISVHPSLVPINLEYVVICVPFGKEFLKKISPCDVSYSEEDLDDLVDEEIPSDSKGAVGYLNKRLVGAYASSGPRVRGKKPEVVRMGRWSLPRDVAKACGYRNDILVFDARTGYEGDILSALRTLSEELSHSTPSLLCPTGDPMNMCLSVSASGEKGETVKSNMCFLAL